MLYHFTAFMSGYILDLLIGDPENFPHPIRLIGGLVSALDHALLGPADGQRDPGREKRRGLLLVLLVLSATIMVTAAVMLFSYRISPYAGMAAEASLTCCVLAAKSLSGESKKVQKKLEERDLEGARHAVSMIVGRDTAALDERAVARAAVETVAENTSDGVIAPLIYTFLGGPVAGFAYKAVNTMDSMVGYHNDRYENFGSCAARMDDAVNFLPARISALLMILAAALLGKDYSGAEAARIFLRDRYQHKSPNSAQTESACAGALGLRLAGDAYYFGQLVKKPFIGDARREIEPMDITRSCRLMYMTEFLALVFMLVMAGIWMAAAGNARTQVF